MHQYCILYPMHADLTNQRPLSTIYRIWPLLSSINSSRINKPEYKGNTHNIRGIKEKYSLSLLCICLFTAPSSNTAPRPIQLTNWSCCGYQKYNTGDSPIYSLYINQITNLFMLCLGIIIM